MSKRLVSKKVYTLKDHLKESLKDPTFKKDWENSHLYIDGTNLFIGQNELFGPKKFLSFEYLITQNRFSLEIAYRADSATVLNFNHRFNGRSAKLPKNLKVINIKSPVCKHTG